jgi:hypothetical protein
VRIVPAAALAAALAAGCGSQDPTEPLSSASSAIQGGTNDTTDTFAVGIAIMENNLTLCSGALLAPNLVATARHCVAPPPPEPIDCSSSTFGTLAPASAVFVSNAADLNQATSFNRVSKIIVPTGANQTKVCGNDLALLILTQPIQLPQYVTPVINPPMTDHTVYSTTITAIGYGVDTPTDTTGATSGVRRIRQDIDLTCIPNDTSFVNCFSDPRASSFISANEFESGSGTCDGDSGSGAYEQRSFQNGQWVSFGVLSRGGVDADGGTCVGAVYTRFDAWGSLLVSAAQQAAQMGGYGLPVWAGGDGGNAAASGTPSTCSASSAACGMNDDCCSNNCVSHDNGATFLCAACDANDPCDVGLTCAQGVCVPAATAQSSSPAHGGGSKGCAIAAPGSAGPMAGAFSVGLGLSALAGLRRRSRRAQPGGNNSSIQSRKSRVFKRAPSER